MSELNTQQKNYNITSTLHHPAFLSYSNVDPKFTFNKILPNAGTSTI